MPRKKKQKTEAQAPAVSGRTDYSVIESGQMVNDIHNYLSNQKDIITYILTNSHITERQPVDERQKYIEHPILTDFLMEHRKHWKALQEIYQRYGLIVDQKHAVTHNETITAKKKVVASLIH